MHSLNLRQRQHGATFLGMVVILGILAAGLYAAIRLVPLYLDYTKVARALEQVRDEHSSIDTSKQMIRGSLERRWDSDQVLRQTILVVESSARIRGEARYARPRRRGQSPGKVDSGRLPRARQSTDDPH